MTPNLNVVEGLPFDTSAVTQTFGFIARKGHGKTYAAGKLVEEIYMHASVIVLDPVGTWYGLRLAADGKKQSAFSIPVFGGDHGDVPITSDVKTATKLARILVEHDHSAVIDVSTFRKGEMKTFVAAFCEELFARAKTVRRPLMIVFEEAQVFAPQRVTPDSARMLGAVEDIVRLGRNCGLGSTMITQRPQSVNKEVLNQIECLFVGQLNAAHERKAIDEWISEKGVTLDTRELPSLPVGTMYLWSPGWLQTFQKVKVLQKKTFDASATPTVGAPRHSAKLEKLTHHALRALLEPEPVEKSDVTAGVPVAQLRKAVKDLQARVEELESLLAAERKRTGRESAASRVETISKPLPISKAALFLNESHTTHVSKSQAKREREQLAPATQAKPARGETAVLTAIAQHGKDGVSREQVTILTGYKRSTRDAYIQRLKQSGYIEFVSGVIRVAAAGVLLLGPWFKPLPTGDALRKHWLDTLPQGEAAVLDVLCKVWPSALSRERISELTGYKRSTRDAYIQRLCVRKLGGLRSGGYVEASAMLFSKGTKK